MRCRPMASRVPHDPLLGDVPRRRGGGAARPGERVGGGVAPVALPASAGAPGGRKRRGGGGGGSPSPAGARPGASSAASSASPSASSSASSGPGGASGRPHARAAAVAGADGTEGEGGGEGLARCRDSVADQNPIKTAGLRLNKSPSGAERVGQLGQGGASRGNSGGVCRRGGACANGVRGAYWRERPMTPGAMWDTSEPPIHGATPATTGVGVTPADGGFVLEVIAPD